MLSFREITNSPTMAAAILPGSRRMLLLGPVLAALQFAFRPPCASLEVDPSQTVITLPSLCMGLSGPPHIGEMATLYGGLTSRGPTSFINGTRVI